MSHNPNQNQDIKITEAMINKQRNQQKINTQNYLNRN